MKPIEAIQDAHGVDEVIAEDAVAYLSHYGYLAGAILSGAMNPILAVASLTAALQAFQSMAGLAPTGVLDDATRGKMAQPRCGCLDVRRMAEFLRWHKNKLTYCVKGYVANLSQADQNDIIALAWKQWEGLADIHLTASTDPNADILISTGQGRADNFDGPSGTLAWAYLPSGGDQQLLMKFDIAESWGKDTGIRMLNVACHEFGHLLGLEHSTVSSALMAPFYNPAVSKPQTNDDVPRIQALYGAATGTTPPPAPVPATYRLTMDFPGPPSGFLLKGPVSYTLKREG